MKTFNVQSIMNQGFRKFLKMDLNISNVIKIILPLGKLVNT